MLSGSVYRFAKRSVPRQGAILRYASAGADAPYPSPRSLGFDLTHHGVPEQQQTGQRKKLLILCGWMGAKPKQLKTYLKYYQENQFEVISFAVGPQHVLRPKTAMTIMKNVVDKALELKPTDVVFHHFSVGGYLFGQMLRTLQREDMGSSKKELEGLVRAQVFDSPPDMRGIAKGVGQSMGMGPLVAKPVEMAISAYLALVKNTAGVEHRKASESFHTNYIGAPSLWFYSESDLVANPDDCRTVISTWREQGTHVEEVVWEKSPHIQHGRRDPERYFGSLSAFLKREKLLD